MAGLADHFTSYHRRIDHRYTSTKYTKESPGTGPREPLSDPPPSKYYGNASYLDDLGELLGVRTHFGAALTDG